MQPALFRQRFRAAEAGTGYFPTEPVMLCDPGGTASDDPVPTVVCKHHTEYRGFRHIGTYFPGNTPVSIRTQKILPKARSVEIPYTQNIFLNLRRCGSGGKNRKIPPFTVSAQRQFPVFFVAAQILQRGSLCRYRGQIAHAQVFFPTDQGIIRPAEQNVLSPDSG